MDEQSNILNGLSIEGVLLKVESGEITPDAALEAEKQGQNRKTLIAQLERMVEQQSDESQGSEQTPDAPATNDEQGITKAVFLKNVKHNKTLYKTGQKVELSQEDYEILLAANVIRPAGE